MAPFKETMPDFLYTISKFISLNSSRNSVEDSFDAAPKYMCCKPMSLRLALKREG